MSFSAMSKKYSPQLPKTPVALSASATLISSRDLRLALGIRNRTTLLAWIDKAGFPAPFLPNGKRCNPFYWTDQVAKWLDARGCTVVWK